MAPPEPVHAAPPKPVYVAPPKPTTIVRIEPAPVVARSADSTPNAPPATAPAEPGAVRVDPEPAKAAADTNPYDQP